MRVYMPSVHPMRTLELARSLKHVGCELFLTGPTASHDLGRELRLTTHEAQQRFGTNVGAYEGDELFESPPDVFIVGSEVAEDASFELYNALSQKRECIICAYSGNFQSNFRWRRYSGVIATDIASTIIARSMGIPTIQFQPCFDFSDWPFQGPNVKGKPLVFRSYINRIDDRYPLASRLLKEHLRPAIEEAFDGEVLYENVDGQAHSALPELIGQSAGTIHVKDQEGFGWSVLETLASGRPLIYQAGLSKHMTFRKWIVDGEFGLQLRAQAGFGRGSEALQHQPQRAPAGAGRRGDEIARVVRLEILRGRPERVH